MRGGGAIIGINYPLKSNKEIAFCRDFIIHSLQQQHNIYHYPKPQEFMEIDRFALFALFSKLTPDNLKVEILYKKGELLAPQRNKLHRLLRQDLGVANELINKKIFFESRYLFNLSYEWEMFKPSSDYLKHELTELAHEFYPAPKEMIIAINNVCNLKCVMCDLHNPELQKNHKNDFFKKPTYLETDKVHEALDYAGRNGVHMVNLSADGEALLDNRLPNFIKRAKASKIPYVFLTTNGTLLDKLGCELLECGLDSMNISIDGYSSEIYEKIRGFPLEKVEEGVIKCAKYARELNAKGRNISFNINCVLVYNEMRNDEFKATFAHKWHKWQDIITHINFISCINKNDKGESMLPVINPTHNVCRLPFTRMMINSYGAVGFCCTMLGTQHYYPVKLPNIHDDSLENIWTKEFATHLRNEVLSNNYTRFNICKTCFERESSVLELNGESKQNNVDIY